MKYSINSLFTLILIPTFIFSQDTLSQMKQFDFVYLDEILKDAKFEIRYAGVNNFVGIPVTGYISERPVMTHSAAIALLKVEKHLNELGMGLKIFDAYRPQSAVNHFIEWSKDSSDTLTKKIFYPNQNKSDLFKLGYISTRSGHSRGSTVDLTLYHLNDGTEVDMGSPYDFFGVISHLGYEDLSIPQKRNRELLRSVMSQYGFRSYSKEWWHYTLRNEPYPKKYFDFVVSGRL